MSSEYAAALAAVLRHETLPQGALAPDPAAFARACEDDDLTGLVYDVVRKQAGSDWVRTVRGALAAEARAHAAEELLRRRELMTVLETLAAANVQPIVIKGMALAYSFYAEPAARRCRDTDLLVRRDEVTVVRGVLARLGYGPAHQCDGELLFYQVALKKTDGFGFVHTLDVHWKISTQSVFAGLLSFDEIAAASMRLPALGAHARGAGRSTRCCWHAFTRSCTIAARIHSCGSTTSICLRLVCRPRNSSGLPTSRWRNRWPRFARIS